MKYFQNYTSLPKGAVQKIEQLQKKRYLKGNGATTEVSEEIMRKLKEVFNHTKKVRKVFVSTMRFINNLKKSDYWYKIKDIEARLQSKGTGLPSENIEQIINRIEMEANEFITWNKFQAFFSKVGRPSDFFLEETGLKIHQNDRIAPQLNSEEDSIHSSS